MREVEDTGDAGEAGEAGDTQVLVIDGTKLLRLEATLDAVLGELPTEVGGERETRRFDELTSRLLAEVGSTLPDPLLDELHRLLGSFPEPLSLRQLRILLVQLEGWVDGLLDAFTLPVDRTTAARVALLAAGFELPGEDRPAS